MSCTLHSQARGAALVVVVYLIAAMGILATASAFRSRVALKQAQVFVEALQEEQAVNAARVQAFAVLGLDDPNTDGSDDAWCGWHVIHVPEVMGGQGAGFGQADAWTVVWRLTDEQAKVNVNKADQGVLAKLPGLDGPTVASILDWIDEDDVPNPDGAEQDYYAHRLPGHMCANGPLLTLEELLLVKGVSSRLYFGPAWPNLPDDTGATLEEIVQDAPMPVEATGLRDLLTVYGDGKININTASRAVLEMIPLLSEAGIDQIVSRQAQGIMYRSLEDVKKDEEFTMADKLVLGQIARFNTEYFNLAVRISKQGIAGWRDYCGIMTRQDKGIAVVSWQSRLRPRPRALDTVALAGQSQKRL